MKVVCLLHDRHKRSMERGLPDDQGWTAIALRIAHKKT
jgi:hypothetical protein